MSFVNPTPDNDPFIHLEETNADTLAWVSERSDATVQHFAGANFDRDYDEVFEIFAATDKLVVAAKHGEFAYDFYTDAEFPRGLWRRAFWEEYAEWKDGAPEPTWQTLLDVGALGEAEGVSWVFGGAEHLTPDYDRALVTLRPGGSDAAVIREFDLETSDFVAGGFYYPESKGNMSWVDRNTVLYSADFGEGSLTTSGYPRSVRLLKRGQKIEDAPTLLTGEPTEMLVGAFATHTPGCERVIAYRYRNFRSCSYYEVDRETLELSELQVPESAEAVPLGNWMLVTLRDPWTVGERNFAAGSVLIFPWTDARTGVVPENVQVLFEPSESASMLDAAQIAAGLIFTTLDNVRTRVWAAVAPGGSVTTEASGQWRVEELHPEVGNLNSVGISAVDSGTSNQVNLTVTGFTTPNTLYRGELEVAGESSETSQAITFTTELLRSAPARYDASGIEVRQRWVTSADGTQVPYFVVGKPEHLDGTTPAPTLLGGYGGFEVSYTPFYASTYGKGLLEKGYVYALANMRGGGEFGPRWHQAALKENRHRAYEDFAAVARDLVTTGTTTVPQLVALGGSNGGLLMGNMYTLYPELFGGIVCMVPLLDMKRYSHLLAGASWMDEYGDPDTDDWEFIKTFSPYHNLVQGVARPQMLITTSTKDDRVHPGHARKFQALLESAGLQSYYHENVEGGHAGAADIKQSALMYALIFAFIREITQG